VDRLVPLLRPFAGREAFVCGPEPFMEAACKALDDLGLPEERVHVERFQAVPGEPSQEATVATAEVTLDGVTHHLPWPATTRLLDVIIEAGLNPPFSCRQGICGACACRVLHGRVHLVHNEILEDEDFADGYILACQALPLSGTVAVTYH
jgi:3-ketosteroid 9alpha-monooxygenase subunit B